MLERFTGAARDVVVRAQQEAQVLRHPTLGTEHLLLALLDDTDGLGGQVLHVLGVQPTAVRDSVETLVRCGGAGGLDADALRSIGIDLDAVRRRTEESFGTGALDRAHSGNRRRRQPRISPRAKTVLELALRESMRRKDGCIGTEHLLLGILREGQGVAAVVLAEAAIGRAEVESALTALRRRGADETG